MKKNKKTTRKIKQKMVGVVAQVVEGLSGKY
jgi:hypothetical protein